MLSSIQFQITPMDVSLPRETVEVFVDSQLFARRVFDSSVPSLATDWMVEMRQKVQDLEALAAQYDYETPFYDQIIIFLVD